MSAWNLVNSNEQSLCVHLRESKRETERAGKGLCLCVLLQHWCSTSSAEKHSCDRYETQPLLILYTIVCARSHNSSAILIRSEWCCSLKLPSDCTLSLTRFLVVHYTVAHSPHLTPSSHQLGEEGVLRGNGWRGEKAVQRHLLSSSQIHQANQHSSSIRYGVLRGQRREKVQAQKL